MAEGLQKDDLKKIVKEIVLSQGNSFIKELLRDNGVKIGINKDDFLKNIMDAIDADVLSQEIIDEWLFSVEGWGDHHIYLFEPQLRSVADILGHLAGSEYASLLEQRVAYDFPDDLSLSTVSVTGELVSVTWHKGNSGWVRHKSKDFQKEEGGDNFEYRAFRQRFDRYVVRFEKPADQPYAAIFVQMPHEGDTHRNTIAAIFRDLNALGILEGNLEVIRLAEAVKNMSRDQHIGVHSTRMVAEGGYVELGSTLVGGGIEQVEPVRQVRRGVNDAQFMSADGTFNFDKEHFNDLSRSLKVQGYGLENRLRIWMQCHREDVYHLINAFWARREQLADGRA